LRNARQFGHLDPSSTKIYQSTVIYGFEADDVCLLVKVRGGYVVQTPEIQNYKWIRGQHIDTLAEFFTKIMPLRIV
jgi:hypothetical protein